MTNEMGLGVVYLELTAYLVPRTYDTRSPSLVTEGEISLAHYHVVSTCAVFQTVMHRNDDMPSVCRWANALISYKQHDNQTYTKKTAQHNLLSRFLQSDLEIFSPF